MTRLIHTLGLAVALTVAAAAAAAQDSDPSWDISGDVGAELRYFFN
ncbi:MAG: hypothetical protein ACE1Z1_03995 [Candidatus Acidiferrales bacterium]